MKYIAALIIITLILPVFAIAGPYYCDYPLFIRGGGFMWLITIALFGFLLYIIYKNNTGTGKGNKDESSEIISILNRRLARGEISEDDYDRLKSRISG